MIATEEPLQHHLTPSRPLGDPFPAVKVLQCEARMLDVAPAEGARLSLIRDPRRPFASGAVLLLDQEGRTVAELPPLHVRALAALLDNGCHVFALVCTSAPRLLVDIHLAPPL